MGAFGVKARYVIDEDGRRTIPYASDAAIAAYEWLNKLYRGYPRPNFVTNSAEIVTCSLAVGWYGDLLGYVGRVV